MDISGCLSIGERVVLMTDTGSEHGTVKWVGVLPDATDDSRTVGVEFDNGIGSGTGKYNNHRLFYAKQNHASVIPILGLIKEEDIQPEHRNMQLDDAISLVSKNFEDYLREKANPPAAAPLPITPTFAAPTSDISYLLNLLADNRQLTVVEIEKITLYLRDRRDKMLEAEGRRPPTED